MATAQQLREIEFNTNEIKYDRMRLHFGAGPGGTFEYAGARYLFQADNNGYNEFSIYIRQESEGRESEGQSWRELVLWLRAQHPEQQPQAHKQILEQTEAAGYSQLMRKELAQTGYRSWRVTVEPVAGGPPRLIANFYSILSAREFYKTAEKRN